MTRRLSILKRRLTLQGVISVYANDHYGAWHSDFRHVREHCEGLGGVSAWMAEILSPATDDYVILKPRHSAFYGTPLELLLTHLRCRDLIVCGLSTDMCVQMTAVDAYLRGFNLRVPSDCSVAATPALHRQALAYMERVLHARTEASDVEQAWRLPEGEPTSTRRSS
jgi:nicotinamidase-related amidase